MIEVKITQDMVDRAKKKSMEMGTIRNSITNGLGNMAGFIGEQAANEIIKGVISNTFDYDILQENVVWDVKTKRCTSEPKPYYECSVAAFNTKQKCDHYVFVRIENIKGKWTRAWVLGAYDKNKYFKDARFLKKGQTDGDNYFKVKADCYNMEISKLKSMESKCQQNS